jgi:subtilisin family serine protease
MPDPNPLDCAGHGSHTSGTAAGFGVTSAGTTFNGHYDATTPGQSFSIGPGVAPLADLYMVRVFGCTGSTNVVVDAIDWAVANDMRATPAPARKSSA